MTAEIAIMNKEAIALAADSAVTMTKEKTFTTANKIFALSKYYPVAIMVYGRAYFMEIPWETIIKIYRSSLSKRKFDTLKEYADDFIAFLNNENQLFSEDQQKNYLRGITWSYFDYILDDINKEKKAMEAREGKVTATQVREVTSDVIKKHYNKVENFNMLPSVPETHIIDIENKYADIINNVIKEVFKELTISKSDQNKLKKISASIFSKEIFPKDTPGVVIAGFGGKEIFPSLKSYHVDGIVNNILKYKCHISEEINFKTNAAIVPFAQQEMVYIFMEGIDPGLKTYIETNLSRMLSKYAEIIVESINQFNNKEKIALLTKLKQVNERLFHDYKKNFGDVRKEKHVQPILTVVSMIPKDELAKMAETLINLTSFKRKVSLEAETVAIPVDVALISKGDGLIWIKRKHYFTSELNAQFFANYYREVENEKK